MTMATMALDPERLCRCHGQPMYAKTSRNSAECNVKRRARQCGYNKTSKGIVRLRAAKKRYRASGKGRETNSARNGKRIYIGREYHSVADTVGRAVQINSHIRRRLRGFAERQSRGQEVESLPTR